MVEVKLLGFWASPYSLRIEAALKIKGVDYEYVEEDLWNKSQQILNYNPVHKKVPILVHTGKPIAESLVILQYIDERWKGNPILPQDTYDKAQARFWAKFIDDQLMPPILTALMRSGEIAKRARSRRAVELARKRDKNWKQAIRGEGNGICGHSGCSYQMLVQIPTMSNQDSYQMLVQIHVI